MKKIKETSVKKFYYTDEKLEDTEITTLEEYIYDSSEEKALHKKQMEEKGFEDSGQVKKCTKSLMDATDSDYEWFGGYFKREVIKE